MRREHEFRGEPDSSGPGHQTEDLSWSRPGDGPHSLSRGEKFVDGNVKATNVLLSVDLEPSVADFGLAPLMNFPAVPPSRAFPGYRAPETMEMRKFTQKSDVYNFGVLLLEMLTGKSQLPPDLYQVCWTLLSSLLSLFVKRYRVAIFNIFLFHTRCSSISHSLPDSLGRNLPQ